MTTLDSEPLVERIKVLRKQMDDALWQRHLEIWPTAVRLEPMEAMRKWLEEEPPYLATRMAWWYSAHGPIYKGLERSLAAAAEVERYTASYRERVLRGMALTQQCQTGVYYELPVLGRPAYRGFRFGFESRDYISGFGVD